MAWDILKTKQHARDKKSTLLEKKNSVYLMMCEVTNQLFTFRWTELTYILFNLILFQAQTL